MENFDIKVEMTLKLSQQDVDDMMVTALEGAITYWCDSAKVVGEYLGQYASEQISRGGKLELHLIEPFDDDGTKMYELDINKFMDGIGKWAEEPVGCSCIDHIDGELRINTGYADYIVVDAIIQYALFGEIVFG